jgi:hypothetical protein
VDRPVLRTTDHSVVWLADLIKAAEVVAASSEPCDPATMKACSDRLAMRTDVRPMFEPARTRTNANAEPPGVEVGGSPYSRGAWGLSAIEPMRSNPRLTTYGGA